MTTTRIGHNTADNFSGALDATILQSSVATNFGTGTSGPIGAASAGTANRRLIQFTGLSNIVGPVTVSSATLTMYNVNTASTAALEMRRLLKTFNETTCTWNNQLTATPWQTAGAAGALDRDSTVIATGTRSGTSSGSYVMSGAGFTALVEGWINGTIPNNGIIIQAVDEGTFPSDGLTRTRESATDGQRPFLTVVYDTVIPPTISVSDVTVSNLSGTATFTVSLSSTYASNVTVDYSTADQTATAGVDYTSTSGTLTFTPGQTSKTVVVPIIP